jgi:hypothetical protein
MFDLIRFDMGQCYSQKSNALFSCPILIAQWPHFSIVLIDNIPPAICMPAHYLVCIHTNGKKIRSQLRQTFSYY